MSWNSIRVELTLNYRPEHYDHHEQFPLEHLLTFHVMDHSTNEGLRKCLATLCLAVVCCWTPGLQAQVNVYKVAVIGIVCQGMNGPFVFISEWTAREPY
jgi:hypothetical protein